MRSQGTASLFFLNPNGIFFGQNARLEIGGSFVGSTADSFVFADGFEFSSTNPVEAIRESPLLTVSVPVGLQFGADPGDIRVLGPNFGQPLLEFPEPSRLDPIDRSLFIPPQEIANEARDRAIQLVDRIRNSDGDRLLTESPQGLPSYLQTLALLGGDVNIEGGFLRVPSGRIDIGGVVEGEFVGLSPVDKGWDLQYDNVANFGNITISGETLIDATEAIFLADEIGGEIQFTGDRVSVGGGSIIGIITTTFEGGSITIQSQELTVAENSLIGGVSSEISLVRGSDITILTDRLELRNGLIVAGSGGPQPAGNLIVEATESIDIQDTLFNNFVGSGLFAVTGGSGSGGNVNITTPQIAIRGGGSIAVSTGSSGMAGTANIAASSIEIDGESEPLVEGGGGLFASGIFGSSFPEVNAGNSGSIQINADRIVLRDGGVIGVGTRQGRGGNITIDASESIEVIGTTVNGRFSSDISANTLGTGQGGSINIQTGRLFLGGGGQVTASTIRSSGNAGDITIVADRIEATGISQPSRFPDSPSGIIARSLFDGDPEEMPPSSFGDAGSLRLEVDELILQDGAQVTVAALEDMASAGNLEVVADRIILGNATIEAETTGGNFGNIDLQTGTLQLRETSSITTNATGRGGNIDITTDTLAALENSDITANSTNDFGGRVSIEALAIVGTAFRETSTPQSDITATSDRGPEFSGTVILETPDVDFTSGVLETPRLEAIAPLRDPCARVARTETYSTFYNVGNGGSPPNPSDAIDLDRLPDSNSSYTEAQGWIVDDNGVVSLTVDSTGVTPYSSQQTPVPGCENLRWGDPDREP